MTQRWYIFRDGRALGPFDAREIRESLREGMWDPFDLVSAEGSSVKIPLVEVDDIFASSQVELAAAPRSVVESFPEGARALAGEAIQGDDIPLFQQPERERKTPDRAAQPIRLTDREKRLASAPVKVARKKSKRDPKRFFLRDAKGRLLGPQSAGEIQSLFYKGVLDKAVKVLKEGSTQAVPVAKFVTVYSERRRKKALQGAHPTIVGGMSTSLLHQVALAKNVRDATQKDYRPLLALGVFIFGLSIALLAIWLVVDANPDLSAKPPAPAKVDRKASPKNASGRLRRPKEFRVKKAAPVAKPKFVAPVKKAAPLKKSSGVSRSRSQSRATGRATNPKAVPIFKAPHYTPKPASARYTQKRNGKSKPSQATYSASSTPSGPVVSQLAAGQVVTNLGPCTYQVSTVKACGGACSVAFAGPGGNFTGKFFGDAYKNTLIQKSGSAYISGTVTRQGSQVVIIISGVK